MSSALAFVFRGWRELGDWYAKEWADAAEAAVATTQAPTTTPDEKADANARLWAKTLAGWGLIANEFLDAAAILSEYPGSAATLREPVKTTSLWATSPGKGTIFTPVLKGDLVSLTGEVLPADCCYFDPAVLSDAAQTLEIVVDRRSKKSFRYKGTVEFHDPAAPGAGAITSVDITVEL